MTHTSRITAMAEKMAEAQHNRKLSAAIYDRTWQEWKSWMINAGFDFLVKKEIDAMLPLARIAVDAQAEAVRAAYYNALGITPTDKDIEEIINQYLITNGYLPETETT